MKLWRLFLAGFFLLHQASGVRALAESWPTMEMINAAINQADTLRLTSYAYACENLWPTNVPDYSERMKVLIGAMESRLPKDNVSKDEFLVFSIAVLKKPLPTVLSDQQLILDFKATLIQKLATNRSLGHSLSTARLIADSVGQAVTVSTNRQSGRRGTNVLVSANASGTNPISVQEERGSPAMEPLSGPGRTLDVMKRHFDLYCADWFYEDFRATKYREELGKSAGLSSEETSRLGQGHGSYPKIPEILPK